MQVSGMIFQVVQEMKLEKELDSPLILFAKIYPVGKTSKNFRYYITKKEVINDGYISFEMFLWLQLIVF